MGYLICTKCKIYYKMKIAESKKDFTSLCNCGGRLRYIENLDIVDPTWKPTTFKRKPTTRQTLKKRFHSISSLPLKIKNRFIQFKNNLKYRLQSQRNWNHNPHYQSPFGINSILSQLNFQNINWILVVPIAVIITLIYTFTGGFFTLLIFPLLILVGYLSMDIITGIKNAVITGALSFFMGSLLTGSFIFVIPLTIVGAINGAVCGWIGTYLKNRYRYL